MSICAYCNTDQPPTREHIIPNWYTVIDKSKDDVNFIEKSKQKIVKSDLVIKDVCAKCNNGPLSKLDDYARSFYELNLTEYLYADSEVTISYEYENLLKWLLKVSYNSARANGTDLEILSNYAQYIISDESLPKNMFAFVSTVGPSTETEGVETTTVATSSDPCFNHPNWFRVGVFRVPDFDSVDWAFRHIAINSYVFFLFVPRLSVGDLSHESKKIRDSLAKNSHFGCELSPSGYTQVLPPFIDSIGYALSHMGAFPFTYGLVQSDSLRVAMDQQFGLVNYWIDRTDVERGHLGEIMSFLTDLISSREVVMNMRGRIEFSVHGYNDDTRELYEINEVVTFLEKLNEAWPYWMLFQHPDTRWLQFVALTLSKPHRDGHRVEFNPELYSNHIERWFLALNELSHKFAITEVINRQASDSAIKILSMGLD